MTLGQTMNRLDELAAKNQALQQEVDRLKTVPKFKEQVHIDRMVKAGCLISVDGTELVIQNQRAETAESRVSELERELADMRANRDAAEAHIEDLQRELAKGKEQRA
jgi:cell division protein FtsB